MRGLTLIGALFLSLLASASGQVGQTYWPALNPVATFQGPGDIVSGAAAAYMLSGYNSAGKNAAQVINLRRSSDNATSDFGLTNGSLSQSAIATFGGTNATGTGVIGPSSTTMTFTGGVIGGQVTGAGVTAGTVIVSGSSPTWTVNISQTVASTTLTVANALFVTTVYDLGGGGHTTSQATTTLQPWLTLNAQNSHPGLYCNGTAFMTSSAVSTMAQPFTFTFVAKNTGSSSFGNVLASGAAVQSGLNAGNFAEIYAGTGIVNFTAASNVPNTLQMLINGASTIAYINGVSNAAGSTPGANATTTSFSICGQAGGNPFIGFWFEAIPYQAAFTSLQATAFAASRRAYWGF